MSPFGPGPVVVGHRGGRGDGFPPENTLAAFERARREGAKVVETDVRLCADEVVLLHDPTLARMTEGRDARAVGSVPWRDLPRVEAGGVRDSIPRLFELLAWAERTGTGVDVEVKHDVPNRIALVRAVARALERTRAPLLVSSFDPFILVGLRAMTPRTPVALLTDPRQSYASVLHALARRSLVSGLIVERRQITAEKVAHWKRRGLSVGVWTVNDSEEARRLAREGVDLLITDRPGELLAVLRH